jgi:hypothetical protein
VGDLGGLSQELYWLHSGETQHGADKRSKLADEVLAGAAEMQQESRCVDGAGCTKLKKTSRSSPMGLAWLETGRMSPRDPVQVEDRRRTNMARTVNDSRHRRRAYDEMRCAAHTYPADPRFRGFLPLLASVHTEAARRDDLLIVLQPERKTAERLALRAGLPPECLCAIRQPKKLRAGQAHDHRTDIFESDVVEDYLPKFLVKVRSNELLMGIPTFALHAFNKYRDRLHQIARRERRRCEMVPQLSRDVRAVIEYTSGLGEDGHPTVGIAAAVWSAWVPAPEDVQRNKMLLEELQRKLNPFEYKVAELYMAGMIHQGDKGDIAKSLGVSSSRIAIATARIAKILKRLGYHG